MIKFFFFVHEKRSDKKNVFAKSQTMGHRCWSIKGTRIGNPHANIDSRVHPNTCVKSEMPQHIFAFSLQISFPGPNSKSDSSKEKKNRDSELWFQSSVQLIKLAWNCAWESAKFINWKWRILIRKFFPPIPLHESISDNCSLIINLSYLIWTLFHI